MKFHQLQAAINIRSDQEPSIYMMMCMIDALVMDIRKAAGVDISKCPVGDESLPVKLVGLCNTVQSIYKQNVSEFEGNRGRLDGAIAKLQATQAELETLAAVAQQLREQRELCAGLEEQLRERRKAAGQLEELEAHRARLTARLQQLQQVDPQAVKAEIAELTAQAGQLEARNKALAGELAEADRQRDLARSSHQAWQERLDQLRQQTQELTQAKETGERELQRLRQAQSQTGEQIIALEQELESVHQTHAASQKEKARLETQIREYAALYLAPAQAALEKAGEELAALDRQKKELEDACREAKDQQTAKTLEIARQRQDNEVRLEKLLSDQERLEGLKKTKAQMEADHGQCTQALGALQDEVSVLEEMKLPEAQRLKQREEERRDSLRVKLEKEKAEQSSLLKEISALEAEGPLVEASLKKTREIYEGLSAASIASSRELEELEKQVRDLSEQNNDGKWVLLSSQLQEKKRKLEDTAEACRRLQKEKEEQEKLLDEESRTLKRWQDLKDLIEERRALVQKQKEALNFSNYERHSRELSNLEVQLKLMEDAGRKLGASLEAMRKTLGSDLVCDDTAMEAQFGQCLSQLRSCTGDLRRSLKNCADSLKMEERR